MSTFRVWTTDKLYAPWNFTQVRKVNIRNVRFETKGLGAAQLDVDLNSYSQTLRDEWTAGVFTDPGLDAIAPNMYIFIERVDQTVSPLNPGDTGYDPKQDPNSSDYVLQDPYGTKIFWWGYISARSLEIQAKSNDMKGSLECLQIGHRINKYQIRHPKTIENGFNPKVDSLWIGNMSPTNIAGIHQFATYPGSMTYDPSAGLNQYWTVRNVVDYLVQYGAPYQVLSDWSLLEDSMAVGKANRWLEQYEQIPSYETANLTEALDDILDTLTWKYVWDSTEECMLIRFMDPIGEMDSAYRNQFVVPNSAKEITITSEEQAYERVVLRGNRVLVGGSISSYSSSEFLRAEPAWIPTKAIFFTNPTAQAYNINTIAASITTTDDTVTATDVPASANPKDTAVEREVERILADVKAARDLMPHVYQHFTLPYASISTPKTSAGPCLFTSVQPGNWTNEKKINDGDTSVLIPFFPRVIFQDPNATYTISTPTGELDDAGVPVMKTSTVVKKINEVVYSEPKIDNTWALHKTPIATEMKFSDFIPWKPTEPESQWFNQPRFVYRGLGKTVEYDTETVMTERWFYGDVAGSGYMSSEMSLDWNLIKLKSPYPELFACPYDYLFHKGQLPGDEYDTTLQDFGFQRTEWKLTSALSDHDPYLGTDKCKGHWGRMIFSFAAYSDQRLELSFGAPLGTSTDKIKFEEDDTLDLWIIRQGFVPYLSADAGIGGSGVVVPPISAGGSTLSYILPYYQGSDIITKNDMPMAQERLTTLWNFWSKPKKAVRVVLPIYNVTGEMINHADVLGNFVTEVVDLKSSNTTWAANSHIASIEYSFESMSPSVTYSTEYPQSPRRTRERKIKGTWKNRRYQYRTNTGER